MAIYGHMAVFFFAVIAGFSRCKMLQVQPCVTYELLTDNPIKTYDIISCKPPQSRMRTYDAYSHFPMGNAWERMSVALKEICFKCCFA